TGSYRVLSQGCFGDMSRLSSQFAALQEASQREEVTTQVMETLPERESVVETPIYDTPRPPAESGPTSRESYLIIGLIVGFLIMILLGLAGYLVYRRYIKHPLPTQVATQYYEVKGISFSDDCSSCQITS